MAPELYALQIPVLNCEICPGNSEVRSLHAVLMAQESHVQAVAPVWARETVEFEANLNHESGIPVRHICL